ncbi:hypothetical protein SAMN02745181_1367 [Rubritalea squalenifaciens DSM 18772]|uniref:Uncharacterized protein n=1 Tax=Rubritalea squalenifaciens DSM 18772 TaxID=1123071 RepID=A0A1M6H556_9BACT|nr:hypothetical protein [Rubritalea squalenifaciens]SHJ17397.1 hypothetical protein SAMN02745181_1367 [Rubritalea squalenifaciens DSM 18772]
MSFTRPLLSSLLVFHASASLQADDLQALGDEFTTSLTQPQWSRLYQTEGWDADQLELWDFNPSYAPGHMVMAPHTSSWYADLKGVLVYKEITGDFVLTTRMRVTRRGTNSTLPNDGTFSEQSGPPSRAFSLAGIFVRNPRNISSAAPDPAPAGTPTYPSPAEGQPGHYTTDWTPDGENYLFLSFGCAGNPNTWQYEVKTTSNGTSTLYYNTHGVPADNASAQYVTLQMVRVGNTIVTMRKHDDGPWIVENRYIESPSVPQQQFPNFGQTLQVGLTTYTDWSSMSNVYYNSGDHASQFQHNYSVLDGASFNPDLIAYVDYYRFQRPDPAITEETLAALPLAFENNTATNLPATGAGAYLGDNANSPAPDLSADSDNDGVSNLIEALTGTNPANPESRPDIISSDSSDLTLTLPHQNNLNSVTLEIQHSSSLDSLDWTTLATRTSAGWSISAPHQASDDSTQLLFTTPLTSGENFYRILVTP